ncbi:hypothetical protein P170DRAFT_427662 [Aspergillus steynii IBT 23096]|uniref:FAD-dependent oxidoreductase 2 FAD-binding domain-containing protein n=1 Tax=Aspergillus steynii IBT 23096 TaxID=1392250 RepID=A0A2I2G0D3_9EURO|nr:uncharacterized protein P170DRAFT_427662 [Aspergillus steynii IBT 23096]PLB46334.1 hypothetical protein P170DRAFT_427662 [Aspergillus steynii IBT 23096]
MAGTISIYDLIIVGHGVAGLAAIVSAAELAPAAQIAVLERAPKDASGGNTRYSPANMRMRSVNKISPGFMDNIITISGVDGDRAYFEKLADQTPQAVQWLERQGVQFHAIDYFLKSWPNRIQPVSKGTTIIKALQRSARVKGIQLVYECRAKQLHLGKEETTIKAADGRRFITKSVILASNRF